MSGLPQLKMLRLWCIYVRIKSAEVRMRFDPPSSKLRDSGQAVAPIRLAIIALAIWLVFLPLCAGAQAGMPGPQKEELTVIRAGTLIDGKGGPPRAYQVIVVRGYRIERVQDAAAGEIPAEAKVIDRKSVV